jgi:hypothetical protein
MQKAQAFLLSFSAEMISWTTPCSIRFGLRLRRSLHPVRLESSISTLLVYVVRLALMIYNYLDFI